MKKAIVIILVATLANCVHAAISLQVTGPFVVDHGDGNYMIGSTATLSVVSDNSQSYDTILAHPVNA